MRSLRSFLVNTSGTTAVMIAVATPLLAAATGAAVDMGFMMATRGELSHLTKVACTRLATSAQRGESTQKQLQLTKATIAAQMTKNYLDTPDTVFRFNPGASRNVTMTGEAVYKPVFLKLAGYSEIPIVAKEVCDAELRVPTYPPTSACAANVPIVASRSTYRVTLRQAQDEYRELNKSCGYNTLGNWVCTYPSRPDEMIVTVLDSRNNIQERDLLSRRSDRGETRASYSGLSRGLVSLQPVSGYPANLPDACVANTPTVNPTGDPPPPGTTTTSNPGSCTPTSTTLPGGVNTNAGATGTGPQDASSGASTPGSNAAISGNTDGRTGTTGINTSASDDGDTRRSAGSFCQTVTDGRATIAGTGRSETNGGSAVATIGASCSGTCTQTGTFTTCAGPSCI